MVADRGRLFNTSRTESLLAVAFPCLNGGITTSLATHRAPARSTGFGVLAVNGGRFKGVPHLGKDLRFDGCRPEHKADFVKEILAIC